MCFPRYLLVERGLIFRRSYYVPLSLVQRVEGQRVWLAVSEATLAERGYARVPSELYHEPRPAGGPCSQTSATLPGLGSTRRLLPRRAIITMGLLGQESIPMPAAPMPPMRLIPMGGSEIVLSSCTPQGKGYEDEPSDSGGKKHLHTRRLPGSVSAHPEQPHLVNKIERKDTYV